MVELELVDVLKTAIISHNIECFIENYAFIELIVKAKSGVEINGTLFIIYYLKLCLN
jgi:hypothetical protein